jgi:alanine racemase
LVEEGVELRQAGVHAPVLVLGGVHNGSEDVVVHRNLVPVVWTRNHLQLLAAAIRRAGAPAARVHLKIDTGMSRLGVRPEHLSAVLDAFDEDGEETLVLDGVMTHLALADETDETSDASSRASVAAFDECCALIRARGFRPRFRHVCNSAGVARFTPWHRDMVRPGIALYGAGSGAEVELDGVSEAMSWHSRLLGVQRHPSGTSVSYGHRLTLARDSVLGIVPVGYGDGYRRSMSGSAEMLVRGHRCRVVGNITMDVCMVDVTDLPDAREGERVTLMGRQGRDRISVYEMAGWGGVLPYEVMCGISKRVPRHWR